MDAKSRHESRRTGFTLVELLVVIVIISLLIGLLTPAVIAVRNKAKVTADKVNITNLAMSLEQYKTKYTDYPPDFFGLDPAFPDEVRAAAQARVLRHFRKAFPRYVPGNARDDRNDDTWDRFVRDVQHATGGVADNSGNVDGGMDVTLLNPASAMVFCLGGPPDVNTKKLLGFSADPRYPFNPQGARMPKLFDFPETQLHGFDVDASEWNQWPTYGPKGMKIPYVYFRPRSFQGRMEYAYSPGADPNASELWPLFHEVAEGNVCVPYLVDVTDPDNPGAADDPDMKRTWNSPDTFQIISPGLDEEFGEADTEDFRVTSTGKVLPNDSDHDFSNDYDNVTSFGESTIEDEVDE